MTTAVHRSLSPGEPLAALLTRNAFSISSDSLLRLKDGEYDLSLYGGLGYVDGDAAAIDRLQRSSARYLQRPDATYVRYDPSRTSLAGVKAGARIERQRGRHWLWEAGTQIESPEFETNDLGRISSADGLTADARLEYRETVPGRWWRNYSVWIGTGNEWNYGRDRQNGQMSSGINVDVAELLGERGERHVLLRSQDERLTRGGPSMEKPGGWRVDAEVESSDASSTRGEFSMAYGRDEDGGLRVRDGDRHLPAARSAVGVVDQPTVREGSRHAAIRDHARRRAAPRHSAAAISSGTSIARRIRPASG